MDDHPLFPLIADIKQDIGRVIQGQMSLASYIKDVSDNQKEQDKKHDDHVKEELAHGMSSMVKTVKWTGGVITFAIGIFEFLVHKK